MTRLERMVTRARVIRAYYEIRDAADKAAGRATLYRDDDDLTEAEFHSGRHCGYLSALQILDEVLKEAS